MTRIGIFLPNWIGDVVMATPALRSLSRFVDDGTQLVGIMRPYVGEVLSGNRWLDERITYDRRSWHGVARLIRQLKKSQLDSVLLLTNSLSTAAFVRLAGIPRRIGFALHTRGWLLTDPLRPAREHGHRVPRSAVDHYLDVVAALGCRPGDKRPELALTNREQIMADDIWRKFGWSTTDSVIVFNTGGAYGAAKNWPSSSFAQLARLITGKLGARVLLVCGPAERSAVARIEAEVDHPDVRSLSEETLSIGLTKAAVSRAALMVTTDSGPRHFASAFGVPVVTLFGPTDPRWSYNYSPHAIDLQLDVNCGPCARRTCPEGHHRCLRDLTVNHVLVAVETLLKTAHRHPRHVA